MKIKPSKCQSLLKVQKKKFSVDGNGIPTIHKKRVKCLGHCNSLLLTDWHCWHKMEYTPYVTYWPITEPSVRDAPV